jgi:hypothetical protein
LSNSHTSYLAETNCDSVRHWAERIGDLNTCQATITDIDDHSGKGAMSLDLQVINQPRRGDRARRGHRQAAIA